MWILNHLADLEADFLVFYRIDNIESLTGPRFLSLALRVFAYQGVMAALAAKQQQDGTPSGTEVRQVESTKTAVMSDPVLAGLGSWGEG